MQFGDYFRSQAKRYFRLARNKSDPRMRQQLESLGREFQAKAEAARTACVKERMTDLVGGDNDVQLFESGRSAAGGQAHSQ
jgi:hypothetical protein